MVQLERSTCPRVGHATRGSFEERESRQDTTVCVHGDNPSGVSGRPCGTWRVYLNDSILFRCRGSGLPSAPGSAALAEGVKSRILSLGNVSVIYRSKDNIYNAQDPTQYRTFLPSHATVILNQLGTSHFVSSGNYQSSLQYPVPHTLSCRDNSGPNCIL